MALSRAHLTWTKEGNALEDRIRAAWRDATTAADGGVAALGRLRAIEEELRRVEVPYEEWEVLSRATLLARVAAGQRKGSEREDGRWIGRTLIPLAVGVVRETLERPRVREKLDEVVVTLLGKLTRRRAS
jgi:hypothetical protein